MDGIENQRKPFVICKAAAGSGKTFNLVKEYLKLAIAGDEAGISSRFRSILAITFTNKAANEMKSRIMDSLAEIAAQGVGSSMGASLLASLNALDRYRAHPMSEAKLKELAGKLQSAILHRYSDLSVCTIDSFMHRVVRTFAHDLDQPVNFEVMIDQDDLKEKAVSQLMSLVGTEGNEELTDVLNRFSVSRMENEKGFDVVGSLTDLAGQLFSEQTDPYLKKLAEYSLSDFMEIYRRYTAENHAFEQKMKSLGTEAMNLLAQAGMEADQCDYGRNGFYGYFRKLADGTLAPPSSRTQAVFDDPDYCGARLCKGRKALASADAIAQRMLQIYNEVSRLSGEPLTDYNTRRLLLGNLFSMALLNLLNRQLHDYARDNEIVHLSDFNKLINSVVRESPAPFFYERIGNRYRHFLIDEFQDTSVMQWHNLVPLLDNGISLGKESLIVGDGKQAIYRFRQGDVRQFVALPAIEGLEQPAYALTDPRNCRVENLDTNFRTADAVVDFNNDFFSWLVRNRFADNKLASEIYLGGIPGEVSSGEEALRQRHGGFGPDRPQGHVGISFIDEEGDEPICRRVLEIINTLVAERGYSYGDIMVLGRTRRELAAVGSYLLENSQVEQSSAESFYLRNSHAVMAVVAALRCLHDPSDRVAAAELLFRLRTLGIVTASSDEAFLESDVVDMQDILSLSGLEFNPSWLLSLDLYDCCEELVRGLRLSETDVAYLASLLNKVAAFSLRRHQGLADFLQWFDDHPDFSAATSDEISAVRLMTIHKAKGLEAPVVICPFFASGSRSSSIWVDASGCLDSEGKGLPAAYLSLSKSTSTRFDPDRDREIESSAVDDLNILYVAFTRPKEQLFVVCNTPSAKSTVQNYARWLHDYSAQRTDYGDPDFQHRAKPVQHADTEPVARISFGDWTSKVCIASPAEHAMTPLMEEKIRFGIYAHALFASMRHAGDIDEALAQLSRQEQLTDDERQRLALLARTVVARPDTARFFDPRYTAKNECDLTDGSHVGRPDRVVFTPDETWVLDFKTGIDLGEEHDRQVRSYCRAISLMGYPRVSGWLLYLTPDIRLRPVDDPDIGET